MTYRLYGWAESTNGSGRFESGGNDIEVNGSVAPLGSCISVTTWDGSNWDNANPDATTVAVIDGNYTANNAPSSFTACSLIINAVSTSTGNPVTLTVGNGGFIEVINDVVVNGNLFVETQGNFVQRGSTGTFTLNPGGIARVNKQTALKSKWYYYTYWSSPVVDETIGSVFPDAPADRRFWFNAANFVDTDGNDINDNTVSDWQYALSGDTMIPGRGYAVTESLLFAPPFGSATGTANFEGEFNNRDVPVTISLNPANTGTNWNFIGNPYPSAIDFDAFQAANSSIIGGAAYFWSQATEPDEIYPGNEPLNFNLYDYAIYTVGSGGTAGGVASETPNGFVASCQGFFVPALSSGTATFTNSMRMADGTSNNQFFKSSNTKKSNTESTKNRLWLNLTSGNGVFNQVLVATLMVQQIIMMVCIMMLQNFLRKTMRQLFTRYQIRITQSMLYKEKVLTALMTLKLLSLV